MQQKIIVWDFGSLYTQTLAKKIRNHEVYSEILPFHAFNEDQSEKSVKGFVLSPLGDNSFIDERKNLREKLIKTGIPLLEIENETSNSEIDEFLFNTCNCDKDWSAKKFIEQQLHSIRNAVGDKKVILGLSGGVDSSVASVLIQKAIGDQLTCIFVDTGLLRKDEAKKVMDNFGKHFHLNINLIDASDRFLGELKGVSDPEQKRKIIGKEFIEVFNAEAKKIQDADFLAQGTIYPDVIESVNIHGGTAVKSHHNVGGLPEDMELELLEPLRHLFKDEVRRVGVELGIPAELVNRHPFPGPGLGVRVLGAIDRERVRILQDADDIFISELYKAELYNKVSQAFVVLLPVKSVGVTDGKRTYENAVAIRSVDTLDFMSARWSRLPYEFLDKVSYRIMTEVDGVNRVTYDISSKPPATIEWE